MNIMPFTLCQDRACPQNRTCQRYDPSTMEGKLIAYFARSPRVRDKCDYYAPPGPVKSLSGDWPKDPEVQP